MNDQGLAAYKNGDYETAISRFEAALERVTNEPTIERNLDNARAAKKKQEQEAFQAQAKDAASKLKGVSPDTLHLKGGNTAFFGLKGISPSDASTAIKTNPPDKSDRDVSTAEKQLLCAADISKRVFTHALNLANGIGNKDDLDEIKYLAGEAANALQGQSVGVQCNSSGSLTFTKTADPRTITPMYKAALDIVVRDSEKLYFLQQHAGTARQNAERAAKAADEAKKRSIGSAQPAPASNQNSKTTQPPQQNRDADIAKIFAQQKENERQKRAEVDQVIAGQQKLQKDQPACPECELLKKAQAELNAANAKKADAIKAVTTDVNNAEGVIPGKAPQK